MGERSTLATNSHINPICCWCENKRKRLCGGRYRLVQHSHKDLIDGCEIREGFIHWSEMRVDLEKRSTGQGHSTQSVEPDSSRSNIKSSVRKRGNVGRAPDGTHGQGFLELAGETRIAHCTHTPTVNTRPLVGTNKPIIANTATQ